MIPARSPRWSNSPTKHMRAGAKDLASNLLWRAAQRCWWSNASSGPCSNVLAGARRLELPELDPRGIAISAYVRAASTGRRSVRKAEGALSKEGTTIQHVARILGSTANVIGAFDLGVSFLAESTAELRKQARIGNLARVLFAQAWAEMEVGDWIGAMREAEEAVRFAEETGSARMDGSGHDRESETCGHARQSGAVRSVCDRKRSAWSCPAGASFLLAMLQLARGISAIGAGRHWEAFEHLRRLFAPADPAFNSGLQFFALADFVEAAVYSDHSQDARSVIDEMERVSAPSPVPWVETMLCYGKALVATQ